MEAKVEDLRSDYNPCTWLRNTAYALNTGVDLIEPAVKLSRESGTVVSVP